jgi:outer membrane lipoprotein-sorting protein
MNNTLIQLENFHRAVPDAPEFSAEVMRRIQGLPAPKNRLKLAGTPLIISALAASILIAISLILILSPSPQQAFAQVVERAAKYDSVRYDEHYPPGDSIQIDHRTASVGGKYRSELKPGGEIFTSDSSKSPDWYLEIRPGPNKAEFQLVDKVREKYLATHYPDNPVDYLRQLASQGVVAAPDEMYRGKMVRVFVSNGTLDTHEGFHAQRVLVDKDTGMPLRIERIDHLKFRGVLDNFEWNPQLDDSTYSTVPPPGYLVEYNLRKPLEQGLDRWAVHFNQRLPEKIDSAALEALRKKASEQEGHQVEDIDIADAIWGFSVPKFAAQLGIDLRYYGAGKQLNVNHPPHLLVFAVETAPGSGKYDAFMTDGSGARLKRSELP